MKTILIVDDEQSFLLALELFLKASGYNVLTASNGEEGLIKVKDNRPDLVLLDIMLPGIGGLETLRIINSHPDFKKIPVILMSGARPFVRQSEYKWAGFLFKPFEVSELLAMIKSHID